MKTHQFLFIKKSLSILLLLIFSYKSHCQVFPSNNSSLNFTQIVFDYKIYYGFNQYKLVLAYNNEDSLFSKNNIIIDTIHESSSIFIKQGIEFNKKYKWKYEILGANNKALLTSPTYFFQTGYSPLIDSNNYRLIFRKNTINKKDNFIVLSDLLQIAFDKNGLPIWYLNNPYINNVRDLCLTPKGTFTFLNLNQAFETDKLGNVLWFPPNDGQVSKDSTEKYHHDFSLLKSSNYIICGQKSFNPNETQSSTGPTLFSTPTDKPQIRGSTIIEYNKNKQVTWFFDLLPELKRNFNIEIETDPSMLRIGHLNGIDVDEKNDYVYASFKNFNNIFKIKKANNSIEYIFGNKTINLRDTVKSNPNFFAAQHAPILLKNGNLMVFNNNEFGKVSSIVELTIPNSFNDESQKVWEYKFDEDQFYKPFSEKLGSVQELNNNHFFVCAGAVNRLFQVNRKKQISWDVLTETNVNFNKSIIPSWQQASSYRAFQYSSLYPYYFTVQYTKKSSKSAKISPFKIFNIGTENDEFIVNYFTKDGKKEKVAFSVTQLVLAQKSKTFTALPESLKLIPIYKIEIVSKNSNQTISFKVD